MEIIIGNVNRPLWGGYMGAGKGQGLPPCWNLKKI
jgi:hypothetical protein